MSAQVFKLQDQAPFDELILVPEGKYTLSYHFHQTWKYMGRSPKVIIAFRIMDRGEHYGKPIFAYYNVKRIKGKPSRRGAFILGWRSDLMFEYSQCFGKPLRKDRIPMKPFRDHFIRANVRTVTHNRKQRKYPAGLEYSVVDELLERVDL